LSQVLPSSTTQPASWALPPMLALLCIPRYIAHLIACLHSSHNQQCPRQDHKGAAPHGLCQR
jgi:hypothetical protein